MQTLKLGRLRRDRALRDWFGETDLYPKNVILPYFVVKGKGIKKPIKSMRGVYHLSIDNLLKDLASAKKTGIRSILLFGIPKTRNESGQEAYKNDGIVQNAIKAIKKRFPGIIIISDVCLCGYTSDGHCGIVRKNSEHEIDNEKTLEVMRKIALSHALAGADFVAPSAMMDGQVASIREALDSNGFEKVGIFAYSAKYASNFYGPFRDALDSTPKFGDRKTYQMDTRNSDEALREIEEDIKEGADIVMVKPALAYLDIIYRAKQKFNIPIAAYNVSGEYGIVKDYCSKIKDLKERNDTEKKLALEILTSIKRAGAGMIITYWAKDIAKWLNE